MLFYTTHIHSNSDSQWVVFIHGAGGSSTIWYKQINSFRKHFNLLFIDLRGHGQTEVDEKINTSKEYTFESISQEVFDVLNHLKIEKAHFIGVSLGTILIRKMIDMNRHHIKSVIMTGAIIRLNRISRFLIWGGNIMKNNVPYLFLYKLFAVVIMPRQNHKKARKVFIREAKKLKQSEFLRWFGMTKTLNKELKAFEKETHLIPILFISGRQDHLFIEDVKKMAERELNGKLEIIENCGHVVNIEKAELFNEISIEFLTDQNRFK